MSIRQSFIINKVEDSKRKYKKTQKIYLDIGKAEKGPLASSICETCKKANGAEGFIGNEYYVDWQGQRLIYVTIQFFALKMRELFEDSETEFGADEHGELLVHESFFSPLDDEKKKKEVKEEGGVRPQKDWRDCWYERYGYE